MTLSRFETMILLTPVILFFTFSIVQHEQTHRDLYTRNGCTAEVQYLPSENPEALAQVNADCSNLTQKQENYVNLVQEQVEATHYITMPLYIILGVLTGATALILRKQEKHVKHRENLCDT